MNGLASPSQKDLIRSLMRRDGRYGMQTLTIMHRRLGCGDNWVGMQVDAWLDRLTKVEACDAIKTLNRDLQ